ncbi:MAG: hypothetical protein ACK40X_02590 [Armatimonadota bacterium]
MKRFVLLALSVSLMFVLLLSVGCKKKRQTTSHLPSPSAVRLA